MPEQLFEGDEDGSAYEKHSHDEEYDDRQPDPQRGGDPNPAPVYDAHHLEDEEDDEYKR